MKFFGREASIGKLEIDTSGNCADSPEMIKRLDRISDNYEKLDAILTELEKKIRQDERLKQENTEKPSLVDSSGAKDSQPPIDEISVPRSANPQKPR